MALRASGCDSARIVQQPRLLYDNGPSYVSSDIAAWLSGQGMDHSRGSPAHLDDPHSPAHNSHIRDELMDGPFTRE